MVVTSALKCATGTGVAATSSYMCDTFKIMWLDVSFGRKIRWRYYFHLLPYYKYQF
jgi:uncharacterized membrane protein YhhN